MTKPQTQKTTFKRDFEMRYGVSPETKPLGRSPDATEPNTRADRQRIRDIERIPYSGHWIEVYHYRDYDGTWLIDCAIDGEFCPTEGIASRGNLSVDQAKQIIDETTP